MQIAFAGKKCPALVLAYAKNYGNQKARSDAAVRPGSYTTVFNRGFLHDVYVIKLHLGLTSDSDSIRIIPVPASVNAVYHLDFPGGHATRNITSAAHAPFDMKIGGHAARGVTTSVHAIYDVDIGGHAAKGITSAAHARYDMDIGGHAVTSRTISSYLRYDISLGGHALLAATRMQRDIYDIDLGGHAVTNLSKIAGCNSDINFSGHAVATSSKVIRSIYDLDLGGHAVTGSTRSVHAIYDLLTSGHALPTRSHMPHVVKDLGFGGHAVVTRSIFLCNALDLSLGGHAIANKSRNDWMKHDMSLGGHAVRNARRLYHAVRDMSFGGHGLLSKSGIGRIVSDIGFAGHAIIAVSRRIKFTGSGGCVVSGQSTTSIIQFKVHLGMGGAVAGGTANVVVIKNVLFTGSGGAVAGGQAITDAVQFKVHLGRGGAVASGAGVFSPTRVALSIVWGHFGTYTYPYSTSSALNPSRANIDGKFTWPTLTPDAGTTMVPVTFRPTDRVNYAPMTHDVPIVVNKQPMPSSFVSFNLPVDIVETKTLSAYKATTTLSGVTFTYHIGSETGPLIDLDVAQYPDSGLSGYLAIYAVPSSTQNFLLSPAWDGVIVKGQVNVSSTVISPIIYGTALSITDEHTHKGQEIPGFWVYSIVNGYGQETFISIFSIVNAGNYTLNSKFIPYDSEHYEGGTDFNTLGVAKATPVTDWPSSITATYKPSGQTVSSSYLNAKVYDPNTAADITNLFTASYTLVDGGVNYLISGSYLAVGTYAAKVVFTSNSSNYNSFEDTATITVTAAAMAYTLLGNNQVRVTGGVAPFSTGYYYTLDSNISGTLVSWSTWDGAGFVVTISAYMNNTYWCAGIGTGITFDDNKGHSVKVNFTSGFSPPTAYWQMYAGTSGYNITGYINGNSNSVHTGNSGTKYKLYHVNATQVNEWLTGEVDGIDVDPFNGWYCYRVDVGRCT